MRYRALISYFGARYVGWQRQLNGVGVQEVVEGALSELFGAPVNVVASGRTDAGVHAEGQVVHFDADTSIPADKIPFAINSLLPNDVSMLSCRETSSDFNARFSAKRKTYCYKIYVSRHRRPMLEPTHAHVVTPVDVSAMKKAAEFIEGTHDFKCFEASGSSVENTIRTVYAVKIEVNPLDGEKKDADDTALKCLGQENKAEKTAGEANEILRAYDCEILISVTGNGFLYNMVRIIAGTLVYAGTGKLSPPDVRRIIEVGDRTAAGKTLPPQGLHLISVDYGIDP